MWRIPRRSDTIEILTNTLLVSASFGKITTKKLIDEIGFALNDREHTRINNILGRLKSELVEIEPESPSTDPDNPDIMEYSQEQKEKGKKIVLKYANELYRYARANMTDTPTPKTIERPINTCSRCNHTWIQRLNRRTVCCPSCGSYKW